MSKLGNVKANSCKPAGKANSSAGCEKSKLPILQWGLPHCANGSFPKLVLETAQQPAPWNRYAFRAPASEGQGNSTSPKSY